MDLEELPEGFTGMFEHTLDAKGRLSLPSKIRKFLPPRVKLVLSLDKKSVHVFDPQAYKAWFDSFFPNGLNPLSNHDVMLQKRLMGFAEDADIDSAGRVGISAKLRGIVGLEKDVTIVGCGDHLEIVDRAKFTAVEDDLLAMDFMVD